VINPADESVIAEVPEAEYEKYLHRKTVYLHYGDFGTPAETHP